jgi:hypothetical protein
MPEALEAERWHDVARGNLGHHELHRDEHAIVHRAGVVHRDHVRVHQLRHRLGLAQQPRASIPAARVHELHRDPAIELRIVRRVHHAHAPQTEHREQLVVAEGARQRARRPLQR